MSDEKRRSLTEFQRIIKKLTINYFDSIGYRPFLDDDMELNKIPSLMMAIDEICSKELSRLSKDLS